mmetsp:Transcript_9685/g.19389  ORF Transcript_9685/g.19389 Transcript_9685/m.19389 type:complete len:167 (-) Transcript_9685:104-604(-)
MPFSRRSPRPVLSLLAAAGLIGAFWAPLNFVAGYSRSSGRAASSLPRSSSIYDKNMNTEHTFSADVGYFVDGTSIVKAGNMAFRAPEPDPHMPGSALPKSTYAADVGYFVDGTSIVKAGNMAFRAPEADPHTPGSPLPPSTYAADVGYFVDGTAIDKAGNEVFRNP